VRRSPERRAERDLSVVETYHPGRQALWSPDPLVRQQRHQDRIKSYHRAAELLRTTVVPAAGRTTTTGTCQADDRVASSLAAARLRSTSSLAAESAVAYDAARKASIALVAQQGLRTKSMGHHVTVEAVVRAQFGGPFDAFSGLRRRRSEIEYPHARSLGCRLPGYCRVLLTPGDARREACWIAATEGDER
jgi:hypothetical protein